MIAYGNVGIAIMAIFHENLMNLLAGLLNVCSVVEVSNFRWKKRNVKKGSLKYYKLYLN